MAAGRTSWALGILAVALWVGAPNVVGQQQAEKHPPRHTRHAPAARRTTNRRQQHSGKGSTQKTAAPHVSPRGVSASGGSAASVPQAGTPTLQNPRPTGTLETLPSQTLTPGATSVPSNAGGIAPASNDASSGEYTPSEGKTAPATPGGNPSNTQGVPTFSSAAQPANANLPRKVSGQGTQAKTAPASKNQQKPQ